MMNVLKKYFYLSLYYGFARYLPPSNYPINLFGRKLRLIAQESCLSTVVKMLILKRAFILETDLISL